MAFLALALLTAQVASDIQVRNIPFPDLEIQNSGKYPVLGVVIMSLQAYVVIKLQQVKEKVNKTDSHHIVAQKSRFAKQGRAILRACGIGINDPLNKVDVKRGLHWILHTKTYYAIVNASLSIAYSLDGETGVEEVLKFYQDILGTDYKE